MRRLKADFHTHCSDDPCDRIEHSAEMLIDAAAEQGMEVLALTCHRACVHNDYLAEYARSRGVLLVPGIEAEIEDRHVLILNPDEEHCRLKTFEELRNVGRRNGAIIAPHPFYPVNASLHKLLYEHIDLFDAVEHCAVYLPGLDFNRRAIRAARRFGLPMVGGSDTHLLPYDASTYTLVEAEPTVESVIGAIRDGSVEVVTQPQSVAAFSRFILWAARHALQAKRIEQDLRETVQ